MVTMIFRQEQYAVVCNQSWRVITDKQTYLRFPTITVDTGGEKTSSRILISRAPSIDIVGDLVSHIVCEIPRQLGMTWNRRRSWRGQRDGHGKSRGGGGKIVRPGKHRSHEYERDMDVTSRCIHLLELFSSLLQPTLSTDQPFVHIPTSCLELRKRSRRRKEEISNRSNLT